MKRPSKRPNGSKVKASSTTRGEEHKVSYRNREDLVNELAKRWWYAMPEWPPEVYDYSEALKANSL